ncbi:hypothetical protein B0J12DRAFT_782479 [Macrophomina phaseolina]|uniref:Alginate lyase domain-containing protein n=1 Tax=Macrophomina phaseolina TaxID=35725 RepID=A0ABQ8GL67_9PEZI|nr:hypothetical protein B0J12DRAFT_782479 [Macrophomina phaseolina]
MSNAKPSTQLLPDLCYSVRQNVYRSFRHYHTGHHALSAPAQTYDNTNISLAAPATFTHPGVLISGDQLSFIAEQVGAGTQPWTLAPAPSTRSKCGPYSRPDIGCAEERYDAFASYAMALAWAVERKQEYADKAIEYMDVWAATLKEHTEKKTAPVLIEATLHISIFLDSAPTFESALHRLATYLPSFIYLPTDGPTPIPAPPTPKPHHVQLHRQHPHPRRPLPPTGPTNRPSPPDASGLTSDTCTSLKPTGYGHRTRSKRRICRAFTRLWASDFGGTRVREAISFNIEEEGVKGDIGAVTEVALGALKCEARRADVEGGELDE